MEKIAQNMKKMEQEKEKIILLSITRYGYLAMPQDYNFLRRHSLLNIYFEIIDRSTAGGDIRLLEKSVKNDATIQAAAIESDYSFLKEYKTVCGNKEVKQYLDNNNLYWKTFLSELKKKQVYGHSQANKEDTSVA